MTTQPPQLAGPQVTYCDVFEITLSPYGAGFRFGVNGPVIQQGNQQVQQVEIGARVSMSLEHLKALLFVAHREIVRHERKMNVSIQVPDRVVTQLLYPAPGNMTPEALESYLTSMQPAALAEWNAFWKPQQGATSPNGQPADPVAFPVKG